MIDDFEAAQASLPGKLEIAGPEYARYFAGRTEDPMITRIYFRVGSILPAWLAWLPQFGLFSKHWRAIQRQFMWGCLNPAVVVDEEQSLIAVYTDLANEGDRSVPVVKVLKEQLGLIRHERITNGSTLAAVATYRGDFGTGRWEDFFPIVVDCIVDDPTACRQARDRIDGGDWASLENALAQLPHQLSEGLYEVEATEAMSGDG